MIHLVTAGYAGSREEKMKYKGIPNLVLIFIVSLALLSSCGIGVIQANEDTVEDTAISAPDLPECQEQPILSNQEYLELEKEIDQGSRKNNFIDTLSIDLFVKDISHSELSETTQLVTLQFIVFFNNQADNDLVVMVPTFASNTPSPLGITINVEEDNGNKITTLDLGKDLIGVDGHDFVKIPPNQSHCAVYEVTWPMITNQDNTDLNKKAFLHPGHFLLRASYTNTAIGYSHYDLNAWIGSIQSDWIKVDMK